MNSHSHSPIYNRKRGCLMAVGTVANPYTKVEVIKPFEIVKDESAPAFVSAGGGQQIRARIPEFKDRFATIDELIEHGYVKGTK